MPRVMTMNKDYQTAPSAPLDLTITTRKSTGSRTPDYRIWEKDARVTGGSPAPPACTGTGSSETHCPSARAAPGTEASASRKRPADSSSSKLPFRKRPITVVPESPRPLPDPPVSRDRFSPAEDTNCTLTECLPARPDGGRLVVAPVTPRQVQGAPIQVKYQLPPMDYHNYGHYPVYLPPVSRFQYLMVPQNDNMLAGISLATRQDEDGDTALHIAVVQGELAMTLNLIEMLVWAHRDLDIYNNLRQTPLHLAVITKQAKIVEALLRARADPAALDRHGQTALHLCCEYNQRDCLSVLLSFSSSSACLEIRNFEGLRPLHLAVLQGHQTLAKMLLDAGADINAMDIKSGQSPLMLAVENHNKDMVDFLIENGCDVNSQSYSGNTALHIACGRGQGETVRLLLKSGADSSLKNYHNDTPVMVAKNKKIADVLRGRGAKQIRVQDQHSMSVSPHGSNSMQNGSPSPNHSIGSSPSTTPHTFHHSACHSPKTQPAFHQLY